ncbi:MAG: Fic family protein [Candidatus Gottesmanbacteria bacterium]|nr:Fic family protein [Candidatus Gottesmanbacteria bacterium]
MFLPTYRISDQILAWLSEIAQIKAMVDHATLLPARQALLRRATTIKMTHSSTSIEGNSLKEYQVLQIADGKRVQAQSKDIREVQNYLSALELIDTLSQNSTFTQGDILAIHSRVITGLVDTAKTGTLRRGPVYVVNTLPSGREQLVYTPPTWQKVAVLLDDLTAWCNESAAVHPIIRAGILHYQFESIHPFTDGNGRVGRLLTLLHLYQSAWNFKKVLVLEDFYNENRKNYYEALQTGTTFAKRDGADITPWLTYFIKGFWEEALRVKEQILSLQVGAGDITSRRLTTDELRMIDFLVTMGKITSADVVDILQVPKRTAQAKLKKLELYRIVKKISAGPSTYYCLAPT